MSTNQGTNQSTRAYLAEAGTPSVQPFAELLAGLEAAVPVVNRAVQQAAVYSELSQAAEFSEADPTLRSRYDDAQRAVAQVQRVAGEIVRLMRELRSAAVRLGEVGDQIGSRAGEIDGESGGADA